MPSTRLQDESGANAVEFALVLPILIVILFGILYGGLLINNQLSVTQAAREGARFGATKPIAGDAPDEAWFSDVRERGVAASAGTLASADAVCVWFVPEDSSLDPIAAAGCPADPPPDGLSGQGDRVVVYASRDAVLDVVLYAIPTTLHGHAVARHEAGLNVDDED